MRQNSWLLTESASPLLHDDDDDGRCRFPSRFSVWPLSENVFQPQLCLAQIIVDDDDSKVWALYDAGPKSIRCPIIFLPPVSGTAEVFFQQVLALTGWGYRVISVSSPQKPSASVLILHLHGAVYVRASSEALCLCVEELIAGLHRPLRRKISFSV